MIMNNKEIGKRIMRLRKEYGYSQDELSEMIGISKNHLSGIERGKYTATTAFIMKISSVLERTPDYFLLGQVSLQTDELTSLIRRLTPDEQEVVIKMITIYLESHK